MPHLPRPKRKPRRNRKPSGNQATYQGNWQQFSEWFRINVHPLCQSCLASGRLVDITPGGRKGAVDHIIQVRDGGSERDGRNLMGLCKRCHDRKSALEGRGLDIPHELNKDGDKVPTAEGKKSVIGLLNH